MDKTFGEFIKERRLNKGLTQKELSKELFVSESAVSKWEKDVARPDLSLLPKLSEILGVSEHELITASVDNSARQKDKDAKKWRTVSSTWNIFFYIAYGVTLLACFIVNLAVDKTLSWFFIVLCSLILAATFTTFPQFIKKHRIIFIPLSELCALILLLGVCNIYTGRTWFFISAIPVVCGFLMIFLPIIIANDGLFNRVKKFNGYISVAVDYLALFALLWYANVYKGGDWLFSLGVPLITAGFVVAILTVLIIKLKIGKMLRAGVMLTFYTAVYLLSDFSIGPFLLNAGVKGNVNNLNPFAANFSDWGVENVSSNVGMIIFLVMIICSVTFLALGIVLEKRKKDNDKAAQ